MAFDGVVLHAITEELRGLLTGGRVEKIFQTEPYEITLLIHASQEHYRLLLSADPASARIHLTRTKKENPSLPPPFCMVLRKYLSGARIAAVRQQGFDRVAVIEFETRNELGDTEIKKLVLEIMNRQSNLILLNSAGVIHDAIRHADNSVNRFREVMPARPYTPPPAQNKYAPQNLTYGRISEALSADTSEGSGGGNTVSKCLLSIAAGFSPALCDAICIDAGINPAAPAAALSRSDAARFIDAVSSAVQEISSGNYHPSFIKNGSDFHCLSVCSRAFGAVSTFSTVNLAVDRFFTAKAETERFGRELAGVMREISGNTEKLSKKIQEYSRELDEAAGFEREKQLGELLNAQLYSLPEYAREIEITDYYSDGDPSLRLELDPSRSVAANAQLYFKRYRKHKATSENVAKLRDAAKAELDYLEDLAAMLRNSTSFDEIADIRSELRAEEARSGRRSKDGFSDDSRAGNHAHDPKIPPSAYLGGKPASKKSLRARANAAKAKSSGRGHGGDKAEKSEKDEKDTAGLTRPIQRISPSGKRILIGRNSRQNEKLTLRDAAPEDMWFHVKNAPGSHVVLKLKESASPEAEDKDIETAAELAAYYSSQRSGSKVDVDYTLVKNVKKIPGGRPGMVTYSGFSTVTVMPRDL
ncbi:MAG: NFACT family protein [Clostridia bacterium]|nr:NFACT family protein [Clostridia bacterium]